MKTIELADREISVEDFSNFELNLQAKTGHVTAKTEERIRHGGTRLLALSDVQVAFDDSKCPQAEIQRFCLDNGFRPRRRPGRRMANTEPQKR